jgi:hypothetical protein
MTKTRSFPAIVLCLVSASSAIAQQRDAAPVTAAPAQSAAAQDAPVKSAAVQVAPGKSAAEKGAPAVPATVGPDMARDSIAKAAAWLVKTQNANGSWGHGVLESVQMLWCANETHYAFQMAANGLVIKALLAIDETPERRAALEKGLEWLCTTRMPKRGSDWDIDCSWSGLYGFNGIVAAALDPRFQAEPWKSKLAKRGLELYQLLEKNQEPMGGWGYYEGPVVSHRPTWSTSFSTACVIPSLIDAKEKLGWALDPEVAARAVRYVDRCRLPNGAVSYDLDSVPRMEGEMINATKGSLGRIQVANWALRRAHVASVTDERIRQGLELFFEHHKFLDAARLMPVPHESWYQNAAYFYFFGHYHAALAINELPAAEREALHARLRPHLVKAQWEDGSSVDFLNTSWMRIAGTCFSLLALEAGLDAARGT